MKDQQFYLGRISVFLQLCFPQLCDPAEEELDAVIKEDNVDEALGFEENENIRGGLLNITERTQRREKQSLSQGRNCRTLQKIKVNQGSNVMLNLCLI